MTDRDLSARSTDPGARAALVLVLLPALALRVAAGALLPNVLWPDEIFQSVEQAHRLVFGYGVIPWEFREGARSWLLPGSLAAVIRSVRVVSERPGVYLNAVRIVLSLLSLAPIVAVWEWSRRDHGPRAALFAAAMLGVWFELVYMAPKALAEVVAAHLLVIALFLAEAPTRNRRFASGLLLGSAIALRLHLAPAIVIVVLAAVRRTRRGAVALLAGAAVVILAAGLLDLVTWGGLFHSYVTTLRVNVLQGRSKMYGELPWFAYWTMLSRVWSYATAPILILAAVAARRRASVLACAAVILLTHSVIGHKEWRFVYPAVMLILVLAANGAAEAAKWCASRLGAARSCALAAFGGWCAVSLTLALGFDSERTLQAVSPPFSHWSGRDGILRAFESLADDARVCGVGLIGIPWYLTGGYSLLHHDIPVFLVRSGREQAQLHTAYDAWLARIPLEAVASSGAQRCWRDRKGAVCVFRREGGCTAVPGYSLNEVIKVRGE